VLVLAMVGIPAVVILVLGLVALLRADRADIPAVVQAIARWFRA
jgi:hypothetical protein